MKREEASLVLDYEQQDMQEIEIPANRNEVKREYFYDSFARARACVCACLYVHAYVKTYLRRGRHH